MSTTPSNPVQSCQPSSMELVTTLRDMRTPLAIAAADRIEYLEATEANKIATLTARVEELETAFRFIADGYDNHDVNHLDYRVKVHQVALDVLEPKGAAV